ncbi:MULTISPECIES: lysozyme inhibitor LprI family protein [Paraburkholderia]|uniref:Uncharacterized conserved protein YecT, DUF1311 family n=1 Tax=Paraburkholderia phenazinium TaxID=60549 RepID=A0A1N6JV86_9BURK|nr:lysozyme inhibitor LprI family protein [Paraburkholderia phenazinium]SIO48262.1 Uncharacterized conserved protein YecT, DUF1311 family [Paraburkholderia phenazinium]
MKKIVLPLLLAAFSMTAHAAGCAKPRNAFDQVYCSSTQFSQSDRDLNQEYDRVKLALHPAEQATLKHGQLAWLSQRDARCSLEKDEGYFVNLECATDMTQQRIAFLRERERECSSTGCVDAKLGE